MMGGAVGVEQIKTTIGAAILRHHVNVVGDAVVAHNRLMRRVRRWRWRGGAWWVWRQWRRRIARGRHVTARDGAVAPHRMIHTGNAARLGRVIVSKPVEKVCTIKVSVIRAVVVGGQARGRNVLFERIARIVGASKASGLGAAIGLQIHDVASGMARGGGRRLRWRGRMGWRRRTRSRQDAIIARRRARVARGAMQAALLGRRSAKRPHGRPHANSREVPRRVNVALARERRILADVEKAVASAGGRLRVAFVRRIGDVVTTWSAVGVRACGARWVRASNIETRIGNRLRCELRRAPKCANGRGGRDGVRLTCVKLRISRGGPDHEANVRARIGRKGQCERAVGADARRREHVARAIACVCDVVNGNLGTWVV